MLSNGVASEYEFPKFNPMTCTIQELTSYWKQYTLSEPIWNQVREEIYQQGRADAIEEYKYNVELFREIFLEELERQAIDREEIIMYRNICSIAWNKYLEQLQEKK